MVEKIYLGDTLKHIPTRKTGRYVEHYNGGKGYIIITKNGECIPGRYEEFKKVITNEIKCCEFAEIEQEKNRTPLLGEMYKDLKRQILEGEKELWTQNRKAYVQYKCCDRCRERVKLGPIIDVTIRSWYPNFFIKWLLWRAVKKGVNANNNTTERS